jgi:hypothetical protein
MSIRASDYQMELELLAKHAGKTLIDVKKLYEREYEALAEEASIPNYISLLALRRVRHRLLPVLSAHKH